MPVAANISAPASLQGSFREAIESQWADFFVQNTPTYSAIQKIAPEDGEVTPYGIRIPVVDGPPGGVGAYTLDSPSYPRAIPLTTTFMLAAPVGSVFPITMLGRTIDMLNKGDKTTQMNTAKYLEYSTKAFAKFTNIMCHGDRLGALAYSTATLTAGAARTLTCETTPTANYGHEKGASRLEKGITYDVVIPGSNTVEGTVTVEIEGANRAQAQVTVTGAVTTGSAIVQRGTWKLCQAGFGHLIGNHARTLQTLDTTQFASLNDPTLDLGDTTLTPAAFLTVRAGLQTRENSEEAFSGLTAFITPGQYAQLAAQGFGFRMSQASESTTYGVPRKYQEAGVDFVLDADASDERVVLTKTGAIKRLVEKGMGPERVDGDWKSWQGSNESGSDVRSKALTMIWNLAKVKVRSAVLIKRCGVSGVTTQAGGIF